MHVIIFALSFVLTFCSTSSDAFEYDSTDLETDAFFLEEPQNVTTRLGERVVLKCRVANAHTSAQWTRGGFGLGKERGLSYWPHLRMIGNDLKTDWNLEIDPVQIEDDTEFQCQMTPLRSRFAYVNVLVPPEDPVILDGPIINVKESMDVSLKCVSNGGKPAAQITWYDHNGNLINDASYRSRKMPDSKLFEAFSIVTFTPTRDHHNRSFRCESWNEAGDNMRPVFVKLFVQYAPSVTVTPVRPGMVQEGDKAAFRCSATANPPPYNHSYKWYIDDKLVPGQLGQYFEIYNVTRDYHDHQVQCKVENDLGTAMGLKTIQVKYGPTILYHPRTTSGDRLETITLLCIVDSNPPPSYSWTKGSSREVVSRAQNMSLAISEETTGAYYCHAETEGYSTVTSRAAEVRMTGPPKITSALSQTGVVGENVHINCAAISIPEAKTVLWSYHQSPLDDSNSHYSIINSPIQHGIRSTLIVRQALDTDFGLYTCSVENSHGLARVEIRLDEQKPFPLQMTLIAIFGGVILLLLLVIVVILFRKRLCCYDSDMDDKVDKSSGSTTISSNLGQMKKNNSVLTNNGHHQLDQLSNGSNGHMKHSDLPTPSLMSNAEADSAWEGSDQDNSAEGIYKTTQLYQNDLEPEFPPKPDVISTGYVPYGQYVRDYNPPALMPGQESPLYSNATTNLVNSSTGSRQSSMLNVSDPRFSATYGNPYLKFQTGPRNGYTTFLPARVPQPVVPNSCTFHPPNTSSHGYGTINSTNTIGSSMGGSVVAVSLPLSSLNNQTPLIIGNVGTSTPNSSLSNMACLPEETCSGISLIKDTPTPPPHPQAATTPPVQQQPIYARIKRDNLPSPSPNNGELNGSGSCVHQNGNNGTSLQRTPPHLHHHQTSVGNGNLATHV